MKYLSQYKDADTHIVINVDPDLHKITIPLPKPPKPRKIAGYGLPAKEQKWRPDPLPDKLIELQENPIYETIEEIWEEMEERSEYYEKEWKYIEKQWERREKGYWFYNNGVPTYITGNHYFHINTWEMDIGLGEYRDRDRRWWITLGFFQKDPFCLGMNYPKHRREGATNRTQCWMYEGISKTLNVHGGIQSMTEGHAQDGVFQDHLIVGWRGLPFFFQPVHSGTTTPVGSLRFFTPARKSLQGSLRAKKGDALNSYIDFKPSNPSAYDTFKLYRYHGDEVGKTKDVDVNKRHNIIRQCLSLGAGKKIIGFCVNTSTVGEMTKGGGEKFAKLCKQSHYQERTENNQTLSGLYNFFMPATEGLEGFIDEYGNSMITEASLHLQNTRQAYLDAGDEDGYNEFVRQHPIWFKECFRGGTKGCNFNSIILNRRLDEFAFGNKYLTNGNFKWENDIPDSTVIWMPDPSSPKFRTSFLFEPGESNKQVFDGELKLPDNIQNFIAGGDPFKFDQTSGTRKSDGSGSVFMKRDSTIDPDDKPLRDWITHRFCCTYSHRPKTKEEFGEDMLMMCIYYGCEMNCEINVPFLWDYFKQRGYVGYLYYGIDRKTGFINKNPGFNTLKGVQDDIYREYHTYIERHGMREVHDKILRQCLDIEDDMGPYDQFVSGGAALLGAKRGSHHQTATETVSLDNFFQTFPIKK